MWWNFLLQTTYNQQQTLYKRLGRWTHTRHLLHWQSKAIVCTKTQNIYIWHSHRFAQYYPTHHKHQYKHQQQVLTTPAMVVTINITTNMKSIQAQSYTLVCTVPKPGRPGTFQEHVLQLNPWEHSLFNNVILTKYPFTITLIFMSQASPLQAAMDGSVANGNMTFG